MAEPLFVLKKFYHKYTRLWDLMIAFRKLKSYMRLLVSLSGGRAAEQTMAHFNVVPCLPAMHIHDGPTPGSDTGCGGDEACLSECVTFPDQRIFLIKVPYPFYHAYPSPD